MRPCPGRWWCWDDRRLFVFCILGFTLAYLVTGAFGFNDRFSMSISSGLRNMGLLLAPIISLVPGDTFFISRWHRCRSIWHPAAEMGQSPAGPACPA